MSLNFPLNQHNTIVSIDTSDDLIELTLVSGKKISFSLFGDCCSQSFFEKRSLDDVKELIGEIFISAEEVEARELASPDPTYDSVIYSALNVCTNKSSIVLDWRNESNGFYSGWCEFNGLKTHPGSSLWYVVNDQ